MPDAGDVLALLWSSSHRCPSGSAVIRRRTQPAALGEVRRLSWEASGRRPVVEPPGRRGAFTCTERETVCRLWWSTGRRRVEHGSPETVVVIDGRSWWHATPEFGVVTSDGKWFAPPDTPDTGIQYLLQNLGWFALDTYAEIELLGRACLQVRATPRPTPIWVDGWDGRWSLPPGDRHLLAVDQELGLVLRLESYLDGDVFDTSDVLELHYGEVMDEALFGPPPPGVEHRSVEEMRKGDDEMVSLDDAVGRVDFDVYVPTGLSDEVRPAFVSLHAWGQPAMSVSISYRLPGGRQLSYEQRGVRTTDLSEWDRIDAAERPTWAWTPPPDQPETMTFVVIDCEGTWVELQGSLGREELLGVAASLVPAVVEAEGHDVP